MRPLTTVLGSILLIAHGTLFFSCDDWDDDHDDHISFVDDVTVEITGDTGVDFEAFFEDDHDVETFGGSVPFSADLSDRVGFFTAVVDKDESGSRQLCVEVIATRQSKKSCTSESFGRVSVTVVF